MDERSRPPWLEADVSLLRSVLLPDAHEFNLPPRNPRLLMLAGLPGCGKSSFAREVTLRCPFLVLESDRLRKALVGAPEYTPGENGRVFRACHRLIDEFLGLGYPVLFDATNLTVRNRRPVCAIAWKRGVPLAVAVATAPPEVARERLRAREAGQDPATWSDAGWDIYCRMAPAWEPVKRPHIMVDTSRDINPALRRVLDWAGESPGKKELPTR